MKKIRKCLLETSKPFLAGLNFPLLVAICSSCMFKHHHGFYGPTKIKEITNLISDGFDDGN